MPESRTMFYDGSGWNKTPGGAIRLDSSFEQKTNVLWKLTDEREWVLADELRMTGVERGFDYVVSPGPNKNLIRFDSVRLVDTVVLHGPLRGRIIYNERGEVSADPLQLGHVFLLAVQDARAFSEAVRGIGGRISKRQGGAAQPAGLLDAQMERMREILREDTQFVQELVSGAEAPRTPFDERGETFRGLETEIRKTGPSPEAVRELNKMREARTRAETIADRYTRPVAGEVPDQLLLSDLSAYLKDTNAPVRTETGLEIPFQGFLLRIGPEGATLIDTSTGEVVPAAQSS